MREWEQQIVEGPAVLHHSQGVAFGYPSHKALGLETLNLLGLNAVGSENPSTSQAPARLVLPQPKTRM